MTKSVPTFDTRLTAKWVKVFGRAAERMAETLEEDGRTVKGKPEGFLVKVRNGPLLGGEVERATEGQGIGKVLAHSLAGNRVGHNKSLQLSA